MRQYTHKKLEVLLFAIIVVCLFVWTGAGTGFTFKSIVKGIPSFAEFCRSMFPPNFLVLGHLAPKVVETIQMALISIMLSALIALPLSFLASKNLSPSPSVYYVTRMLLNLLRSVPTLMYALVFIAMVGLGSFPGVLGLTAHCIGTLGKYFSETIENISPDVIEGARSVGASKTQVIIYAVIPELSPAFASYTFYYLEYCIRTASMMGVVGAGGIGMALLNHIRLFRYQEAFAILIVIVILVTSVDFISFLARKRMIGLEK